MTIEKQKLRQCFGSFMTGVTVVTAMDENGNPIGGRMITPLVMSGIAMLLVSGMMRHTFEMAAIDTMGKGLTSGLGVGLFFISPWIMINNAYGMRPFKLTLIDGGYAVTGCGLIGLILTAM